MRRRLVFAVLAMALLAAGCGKNHKLISRRVPTPGGGSVVCVYDQHDHGLGSQQVPDCDWNHAK